ncbi:MAG TPA: cation:proton antiporter [Devosiaceae bacterium]
MKSRQRPAERRLMNFAHLLIVVIAAIGITIFAERRDIQAPLLISLVGLAASFIPGVPRLELEPHIILTIVLPPLLFSAASEFSLVSFVRRLGSIVNLGVFLVAVTTGVVGAIAFWIVPYLSLPAAMVLAAVVSPTDAVTAVAIGRKLGLPSRLMTVLKGESLINDAAALTLFSFTAATITGFSLPIHNIMLYFAYSAFVGIFTGSVLAAIVHRIRMHLTNASLITVLNVLVPFTAYMLAEEFGASGVLAVVAAGLTLGHNSPETAAASRIQERQFWSTLDALLEAFVFAYIGLQLRFVIDDAQDSGFELWGLLWVSLLVLAAVIGVRLAWVFLTAALRDWTEPARRRSIRQRLLREEQRPPHRGRGRRRKHQEPPEPFPWRENLIIGWSGMRGVVTLAAASGVPVVTAGGEPFEGRNAILAIAFIVTIGTLLIQGLTLPWLIDRLQVSDPNEENHRLTHFELARTLSRQAAIDTVTVYRDQQHEEEGKRLAQAFLERLEGTTAEARPPWAGSDGASIITLSRRVLQARRQALIAARDAEKLDDEVLREVLEQMDREQAVADNWSPQQFR